MNVVNQFKEIKFKDILLQVKEKKTVPLSYASKRSNDLMTRALYKKERFVKILLWLRRTLH